MGALGLAIWVAEGSRASAHLAALLQIRLHQMRVPAQVEPSELGLTSSILVATPEEGAHTLRAIRSVLARPVARSELTAGTVSKLAQERLASAVAGPIAWARCSGALQRTPPRAGDDPVPDAQRLEALRARAFSSQVVRFAAVGPARLTTRLKQELGTLPAWPEAEPPAPAVFHTTPVLVETHSPNPIRLSLLTRLGNGDRALAVAQALQARSSPLQSQLRALGSRFRLVRAGATFHTVGGCLYVVLEPKEGAPPSGPEYSLAARVLSDETRRAIAATPFSDRRPLVIRSLVDPGAAARLAAWSSLSRANESQPPTAMLLAQLAAEISPAGSLEPGLRAALGPQPTVALETRVQLEQGQGQMWALVASTCGTGDEPDGASGAIDVWLSALARSGPPMDPGMEIEPWVTPEGAGLILHATPLSPDESAPNMAKRMGFTLGRLLSTHAPGPLDMAEARQHALDLIGPGPRRGFWMALSSLTPNQLGQIWSHGTFQSLQELQPSDLENARHMWLRQPLRVALLTRDSEANDFERALWRWLWPHRDRPITCGSRAAQPKPAQSVELLTATMDHSEAAATLALPLNLSQPSDAVSAQVLIDLLAGPHGWLERVLVRAGLPASTQVTRVGSGRRQGLVIQLGALNEGTERAISEVCGLLDRLGSGTDLDEQELIRGLTQTGRRDRANHLDPRRRLLDLWFGLGPTPPPTPGMFRDFLRRNLRSSSLTVVRSRSPEPGR